MRRAWLQKLANLGELQVGFLVSVLGLETIKRIAQPA
jgi:hypothetical protein